MVAIADASYVIALLNRQDPDHRRAAAVAGDLRVAPWLPSPAVTEICYVLARHLGHRAVATFLQRLAEPGAGLAVLDPTPLDYLRAGQVLTQYADSGLDFVDALIVAVAERLGVQTLLTLDRRHFGLVRPLHCAAFDLLPA